MYTVQSNRIYIVYRSCLFSCYYCCCSTLSISIYFGCTHLGGFKTIPVHAIDPNTQLLAVYGPKNNITMSPIFGSLKRLEVLRIVDSNVPMLGMHTFWGIQSLRILGKNAQCEHLFGQKENGWANSITIRFCRSVWKQYNNIVRVEFSWPGQFERIRFIA